MQKQQLINYNDRACFSKYFKIKKEFLQQYGAIDICLYRDLPLFIDPMLIFNSEKPEYKDLHNKIIEYFHFLSEKTLSVDFKEVRHLLVFKEVKNTWLGYSRTGNCGTALRDKFARRLYHDLPFVFSNTKISKSFHLEKAMLLYEGDGKDKISDMTTKLILPYLYSFTERFTKRYISPEMSDYFTVDFNGFNYKTESFFTGRFLLPFVYDSHGRKEYVLLTPMDIVRAEDQAINRHDLLQSMDQVLASIDNEYLRNTVRHYIINAVTDLHRKYADTEKEPSEKEIKKAKELAYNQLLFDHPELYDYYIRFRESCTIEQTDADLRIQLMPNTVDSFLDMIHQEIEKLSSFEETKDRIKYFKHTLEERDVYKLLWRNGNPISEKEVHFMFDLVWYKTNYLIAKECNNGRGPADFNISYGKNNQTVVEFKLATNPKLKKAFSQVNIYANASEAKDTIVVVICFTDKEIERYWNMLEETNTSRLEGDKVFYIDARIKQSASKE